MWNSLFKAAMARKVRQGDLTLTLPDGGSLRVGDRTGPPIHVTLKDATLPRRFVMDPELALGEGYMTGGLTIDEDDLVGLLSLAIRNANVGQASGLSALSSPVMALLHQINSVTRARRNVAHHYDLSTDLYDLFLDADRQYSCAYFARPEMSLEEAQAAKKALIARKLRLGAGMKVLDIGCGWGGMALTLAREHGVHVTGITLSREQHDLARARVAQAGLADQIDIRLEDYRHVNGPFDRIVSVGMFEHVGRPYYRVFFRRLAKLLRSDGVALLHTIGRNAPPGRTSPWIDKYIFPGGYVPALSEATRAIEASGLMMTDIEVWRLHYAETLRHWRTRFEARQDAARALYDEAFCRMWRYYLVASELTFRLHRQVVFQIQLTRQQDAVPLTRDYLCTG